MTHGAPLLTNRGALQQNPALNFRSRLHSPSPSASIAVNQLLREPKAVSAKLMNFSVAARRIAELLSSVSHNQM